MKLADIEEKAQHYFEWPDGVPKNSVTLTSATLFARACVNEAVADHEAAIKQAVEAEREACAMLAFSTSAYKAIRQRGEK